MNEQLLKKLLITINQHLPKKKISLSEALKRQRATYEGKDGRIYLLSREELLRISELLPETRWDFLKIPIVFRGDPMGESPGWIVMGADECRVIAASLNKPIPEGKKMTEMKIYHAHMIEIRRMLSTTTVIMSSV